MSGAMDARQARMSQVALVAITPRGSRRQAAWARHGPRVLDLATLAPWIRCARREAALTAHGPRAASRCRTRGRLSGVMRYTPESFSAWRADRRARATSQGGRMADEQAEPPAGDAPAQPGDASRAGTFELGSGVPAAAASAAIVPRVLPDVLPTVRRGVGMAPVNLKFVEGLKRRNVGRVALLYLGICWVVLEPVHVIFHMLGVPEWVNRLVVVGMALGFPVALISAWIYEMTPVGLPADAASEVRHSLLSHTSRRLNYAMAAVAALMAIYFLVYHFWLGKHLAEPVAEVAREEKVEGEGPSASIANLRSIAVLPFIDMTQAKDQEYLSDGLAEELLNLLAKIPELRVAARTSAFAFKNKSEDVQTVAKKLHVAHILEGSVRKSGNRVRITAQLIRADSGYHLWSETYDRDLTDIFKLQDEIAGAVVQALKVTLLAGALPERAAPKNPEAYSLYLQGRFYFDLHTKDALEKSIDFLHRAAKLDPTYEPTWTTLSIAYGDVIGRGLLTAEEALRQARAAAKVALELNPKSAPAHVAIGLLHMNYDWDWAAADREFKQALEFEPGNSAVLNASANLDLVLGRTGTGATLFQQALARDPLSASSYSNLGVAYYADGRLADAEAAFRKSIELQSGAGYTHNGLGLVLLSQGKLEAALEEMRRESDETWRLQGLAVVYAAMGRREESERALAELTAKFRKDAPYAIATVHGYRGETDLAFEWLERAYAERDATLAAIKVDPLFHKIVADPRYATLLRKVGLPV
jgi:TolB-like protein/Flp pilus assembly protein TadD